MLRLFYADLSGFRPKRDSIPLSEYRKDILNRSSNPLRHTEALAAEAILNRAVSIALQELPLPLEIYKGEHGKPYLCGGELYFNLSHSGKYVVCALADREVGVDVQQPTRVNEAVIKRFFSDEEASYIHAAEDRDRAFAEVWSLKESYIKALGTGIATPLSSFSVKPEGIFGWSMRHFLQDGYHFAVCLSGELTDEVSLEATELL